MATLDQDDREFIRALIRPVSDLAVKHERALYGDDDTSTGLSSKVAVLEGDRTRQLGISGVLAAVVAGVVSGVVSLFGVRSS